MQHEQNEWLNIEEAGTTLYVFLWSTPELNADAHKFTFEKIETV